jgi:hypothetical protein
MTDYEKFVTLLQQAYVEGKRTFDELAMYLVDHGGLIGERYERKGDVVTLCVGLDDGGKRIYEQGVTTKIEENKFTVKLNNGERRTLYGGYEIKPILLSEDEAGTFIFEGDDKCDR